MAADALVGLIMASILIWVIYGPWQMVCTDTARHELFELRDQLFDLAADGKISFESVEYQEIRSALNLMIRYAHRITIPRLIMMMLFRRSKPEADRPGADLLKYVNAIEPDEVRVCVRGILMCSMEAIFKMIRYKSPSAMLSHFLLAAAVKTWDRIAHRDIPRLRDLYRELRARSNDLVLGEVFCSES